MRKNKSLGKDLLLLASSVVISLVILEIGVRCLTPFPIHGKLANRAYHPVLGYTMSPANKDIDESGFRNPDKKNRYDIVAIGDSHTYGFNVEYQDSWPYQLASMINVDVYNYGIGGYSIYHYAHLAELSREKFPALVLLALYPANDLLLEGPVTEVLRSIDNLDLSGIKETVHKENNKKKISGTWDVLANKFAVVSALLYLNKIYQIDMDDFYDVGGQLVRKKRVARHRKYTDLSDPVVQNSFKNSLIIVSHISETLERDGIRFGVLILPSKEMTISEWALENQIPVPDGYRVDGEKNLFNAYAEYFQKRNISYIDATPYVIEAFQTAIEHSNAFYLRGDGHPFANGYKSYAIAAETLIREMKVTFD